ncbi:MAG: hypothetical protein KUA37_06220 [Desulfomicrobium sp.]|uniref:phosphoglycerate kinase n=1 Tax=Hoeflea sp. TaxID=1940281 RepID=UPI0025BF69A2|nr:phosphoglycerate kinase [Hoeflea sp.]MBV1711587.1 hypothetical protein [Desulfomicrobium sp.]MBV1782311.1 phosphoglycerate kinase [Hoeflea sp.]
MGLDMYAFTTPNQPEKPVDIKIDDDCTPLFYWRKHPDLHGWMEELYLIKGGAAVNGFNCETVELTLEDLDTLQSDIHKRRLPHTEGFFFGESSEDDIASTLEFIILARQAINHGLFVLYDSWW